MIVLKSAWISFIPMFFFGFLSYIDFFLVVSDDTDPVKNVENENYFHEFILYWYKFMYRL